jgi:hypothetical protein
MTTRDALHRLIDALPDAALPEAERVLVRLTAPAAADPVLQAFLDAPVDDEPLSAADVSAIEEGKADLAHTRRVSLEQYEARRSRAG